MNISSPMRLYAYLADRSGLGSCRLSYRGETHEEPLPHGLDWSGPCPVLLRGLPGAFRLARIVEYTAWRNAPTVEDLRANRRGTLRLSPRDVQGGVWSTDEQHRACELGETATRSHGAVAVVSYTGFVLSDLPDAPLEAIETWVGSLVYYVIPARAFPLPAHLAHKDHPPSPSHPSLQQEGSHPVDESVPLPRIHFLDRAVRVCLGSGREVVITEPRSRLAFDAIKAELEACAPEGLRVSGAVGPGERHSVDFADPTPLDTVFRLARRTEYLRRISRDRVWRTSTEVRAELELTGEDETLLDVPELGFERRKEAFARLFRLRDPSREIHILPDDAMLIPVASRSGGPGYWVWEIVKDDNATYVFRPSTKASLDHLFEWLASPQMTRKALLESTDLQRKVGFARRIFHRDVDEPLDAWWQKLREALGREVPGG